MCGGNKLGLVNYNPLLSMMVDEILHILGTSLHIFPMKMVGSWCEIKPLEGPLYNDHREKDSKRSTRITLRHPLQQHVFHYVIGKRKRTKWRSTRGSLGEPTVQTTNCFIHFERLYLLLL